MTAVRHPDAMIDARLLDLLGCPVCRAGVIATAEGALRCPSCGSRYPVLNGIPRMLPIGDSPDRERNSARHFSMEFALDATAPDPPPESTLLEYLFLSRTGLDPGLRDRTDIAE